MLNKIFHLQKIIFELCIGLVKEKENLRLATSCFEKTAKQDNVQGQINYAIMLKQGSGVKKNIRRLQHYTSKKQL